MSFRVNRLDDVTVFRGIIDLTETVMIGHLKQLNKIVDFDIDETLPLIEIYKLVLEKVQDTVKKEIFLDKNKYFYLSEPVETSISSDLLDLFEIYKLRNTEHAFYYWLTICFIKMYNMPCWFSEGSEIANCIDYCSNTEEDEELSEEEIEYRAEVRERFLNTEIHDIIENDIVDFTVKNFIKNISKHTSDVEIIKLLKDYNYKFNLYDYMPVNAEGSWAGTESNNVYCLVQKESDNLEFHELDSLISDALGNMSYDLPRVTVKIGQYKDFEKKYSFAVEQWEIKEKLNQKIYDINNGSFVREKLEA